MSQIMKAFMGIFIILFMVFSSMGVLGAFLQVERALEFHSSVIDELENSDYADVVLENCLKEAEQYGYELEVTMYEECAEVDLGFNIRIPFFGIESGQKIHGYGR